MQTFYKLDVQHDRLIVTLTGSMTFRDYAAADELIEAIFTEVKSPLIPEAIKSLVFDLTTVTMIDSHWLGMFVRTLKRAEENGIPVTLRGAQPPVRRLLDLVQFDRVFRIEA